MSLRWTFLVAAATLPIPTAPLAAQAPAPPPPIVGIAPDALTWRPAAPGVQLALAEGTPAVEGARFTMLLKFDDGGWINPHWHNVEKLLTVISGELLLGEGDQLDPGAVRRYGPGSVIVIPAERRHYEGGRGPTLVAMTAVGPFRTMMVTP